MIKLRFKVDPEYLRYNTEVENPVRIKILPFENDIPNDILKNILGESGRKMAADGATFIFEKDLAYQLVKAKVAILC